MVSTILNSNTNCVCGYQYCTYMCNQLICGNLPKVNGLSKKKRFTGSIITDVLKNINPQWWTWKYVKCTPISCLKKWSHREKNTILRVAVVQLPAMLRRVIKAIIYQQWSHYTTHSYYYTVPPVTVIWEYNLPPTNVICDGGVT